MVLVSTRGSQEVQSREFLQKPTPFRQNPMVGSDPILLNPMVYGRVGIFGDSGWGSVAG